MKNKKIVSIFSAEQTKKKESTRSNTCIISGESKKIRFFRKSFLLVVPALFGIVLSSCTLAPKYARPDAPIPNVYTGNEGTLSEKNIPWRDFFKDPVMQRLIGLSLQYNRDLRIAMLNIEKTRAQYHIQASDLLPTVNGVGEGSSQRVPADISGASDSMVSRQYSAGLGFSNFELDLFGRIRSLYDAAKENYYSIENDARTARLSLVAEVAAMYLQLVADRQLYDITERTYANRKSGYESVALRQKNGVSSELEANQAKTLMEEARVNLTRFKVQVEKDENYLALLIGTSSLPADIPNVRKLMAVAAFPDVPAGLPSSLLERRPDIISAEHLLKSANANIGAARANFFPKISLTGTLGSTSPDAGGLFGTGHSSWSFIPSATIPLFDTGRNIAQLNVSEKEKEIAIATYQKTIQSAFREVADALSQRHYMEEQLQAQKSLLDTTKHTYALAQNRYDIGIDNQITVLDSQRSLYSAEQEYVNTLLLRESNALNLYKALGGGWF